MLNINYTNIKQIYQNAADDFINNINATDVTFYLRPNQPQADNFTTLQSSTYDFLGGREEFDNIQGNQDKSPGASGDLTPDQYTVRVRAYWNPKQNSSELSAISIKDIQSICKIISFSSDNNILKESLYAKIDGYDCKLVLDPIPHGIFGDKRYSTSYWEIIK